MSGQPALRPPAGGAEKPAARAPWLVLAPVLLLAVAARGYRLGARGLWLDEAMSHHFAAGPLAELPARLRLDSGPPLYYLLLKLWMALFGDSQVSLRALSALGGTALVAMVYWVGRKLWSTPVGLAAALLTAVLPIQLRYAQEARAYTLLALLGLVAFAGLERWIATRERRWLVVHALGFAAALYCHNYAVFLWIAGAVFATFEAWRQKRPLAPFLGLAGALAAFLPWWPILGAQLAHRAPYAWMSAFWVENRWWGSSTLGSWAATLKSLSPAGAQPPYVGMSTPEWGGPTVLLLVIALYGGLWAAGRQVRQLRAAERPAAISRAVWLACYALVPLVAAAALSVLRNPVYLPGRLDQLVVPAVMLAVAVGLEALPLALLRAGGLALFCLLGLATWHHAVHAPEPAGERELAAELAPRLEDGDALVVHGLARAPLAYALRRAEPDLEWRSFPDEIARHPGYDASGGAGGTGALAGEAARLWSELGRPGAARRVFLVLSPTPQGRILLDALRRQRSLAGARQLGSFQARITGQPLDLFEVRLGPSG